MRYALFILSFWGSYLCAQPSLQWQKCLGGFDSDALYSATQADNQSLILTGRTFSSDGDVTGQKGNGDIWVVKLDSTGEMLWQKCFGGSSTDLSAAVAVTFDNGYIIAGSSISNDLDVSGNHGDVDFWVIKLNNQGELEWQKSLGGSKADYCQAVTCTQDGGYIFTGYTGSSNGDVTGNHGQDDVWVVKLSHLGALEWEKCLGGTGTDRGYSIIESANGEYIIAGETDSKDGNITHNFGNVDYWVVNLDQNGNILWQNTYGGVGLDKAQQIVQLVNGDFLVTGITGSGNSGQVTGSHGSYDYWILRINPSGGLIWQKALGGSGADYARSAAISPNDDIVIAGFTASNDGDVITNIGGLDMWILKLNADGILQWQKTIGGTKTEELYDISNTSKDGGYIVTGKTWSNDGDVFGNHGAFDAWVVKLSPTNTPTLTPTLTQLTLYPNPTSQQITLQTPDNEPITSIQITDLSGKTLKTEQAPQDKTLQVAILPKGMYLLKAASDSGKVFCGSFIKE